VTEGSPLMPRSNKRKRYLDPWLVGVLAFEDEALPLRSVLVGRSLEGLGSDRKKESLIIWPSFDD
jgi:hypothetical protein